MKRVGRTCIYEEDLPPPANDSGPQRTSSLLTISDSGTNVPSLGSSEGVPGLPFAKSLSGLDPFRHDTLRQPTADLAISKEAIKILGTLENTHRIAVTYFATISQRMPIVSRKRLFDRLPSLFASPRADFTALCLCIHLVQQAPPQDEQSMQSLLYVTTKSVISLLESTGYLSLNVIQCRLLLTFYELGHGIYPAASISIGACARAARALGLNKKNFHTVDTDALARIVSEEEKRVWYAVMNLDR